MSMFNRTNRIATAALPVMAGLGLLVASPITLAEPDIYIGAAYGIASFDGGDFDDDTQVLKAFVGGKFSDYLGVEAAANDYGEAKGSGFKSELNGYSLAVVGFLPLGESVDLFAKMGNMWWKNDYTILGYSNDADGSEIFYGLGAQFNLTQNFAFRLEVERYKVDLGRDEIGFDLDQNYDVDIASVGAVFTF